MEQMPQRLFEHYFMVSANRNPEFTRYVFKIHVTIIVLSYTDHSHNILFYCILIRLFKRNLNWQRRRFKRLWLIM